MNWDFLISGIIANMILNNKENKKTRKSHDTNFTWRATTQRDFIRGKNTAISDHYLPIQTEWISNPGDHLLLPLFQLNEGQIRQIQYYYTQLKNNSDAIYDRTALIYYLWNVWKNEDRFELIDLIQNELIFIINHFSPSTQQEHMYQHLAMFLSSECYLFKGDFTNALKRLYQTLNWQAVYDNISEKDDVDAHTLADFLKAVISNIINIYALVDLSHKTDEIRSIFNHFINEVVINNTNISTQYNNDIGYLEYLTDTSDALMTRDRFVGYYLFEYDKIFYKYNFFLESCYGVVNGDAQYSIMTRFMQPKDIYYNERESSSSKTEAAQDLCFRYNGSVQNYKDAITRCHKDILNI